MRVAVTGASGFVGGVIARRLAASGHAVFSFGRRAPSQLSRPLPNYAVWDLADTPVEIAAVDAVVHCAAHVDDWGPADDFQRVNVLGTGRVLQTFAAAEHFVHISSASVYSSARPAHKLREDAPVGAGLLSNYARSKADAEALIQLSSRRAVILRPHIVYGPGDATLLPRVLAARRHGWLVVPGSGRNRLSVTHVFNLAHAVECLLASSVRDGVFNIVDAQDAALDELLHTLLQRNGTPTRLLHIPRALAWGLACVAEPVWRLARRPRAPGLTRYVVAHLADEFTLDGSAALARLGYAPQYDFRNAPLHDEDTQ